MSILRFAAAAAVGMMSMHAFAAELSLPLTDDNYLSQLFPNNKYGGFGELRVDNQGPRIGLLRFDASTAAGASIQSATLRLFIRDVHAPTELSVYALSSTWREDTSNYTNRPTAESPTIATTNLTIANKLTVVELDVTSVVQRWADGTLPDVGLQLRGTGALSLWIDSKERAGGTRAALVVVTADGPPPLEGELPTTLDLSLLPLTIEEPGTYILDRDWDLGAQTNMTLITVAVSDVVLDLRGFGLKWDSGGGGSTGIAIQAQANDVTVRNGVLSSDLFSTAVASTGGSTVIENVEISFTGTTRLSGANSVIRNSTLLNDGGMDVGDGGRLYNNEITVNGGTLRFGTAGEARNNRISGGQVSAVTLSGDGVLFRDNVVSGLLPEEPYLTVESNSNVILDNTLRGSEDGGTAIRIAGTANVVRGNLALPTASGARWSVGIAFETDGNFYGDNQAAALVPFALGSTVQTDWGDNIGF